MVAAIFCASRTCGLVSDTASNGASQASISGAGSGSISGHISTRAGPGGELRRQPLDDVPLPLAGVLRLVDQDVIQSEIELVVHPAGIHTGEQPEGLVDQVVIVEETAAILLGGVAVDHPQRDGDE